MSYEYRVQMMNGTIKDAKDNYENAQGNAEKEKYEIEIQRLQSLQNAYKTAGEYEAKAKAFEEVASIAYWYFERVNPEYADFSDYEGFYDDIKDVFKRLESGESE